jgi:N-acetylglucosaminyldiphosphoundecaprenol N-acetyl-beta-D-mannosaminyltransferase
MNNSLNEPAKSRSIEILGVTVHPLSISQLNHTISEAIDQNQHWIIANHNLHSVYIYHHQSKMRDFYAKSQYIHIDSMALILLGKILGFPLQRDQRVTYVDWTNPLMAAAAKSGWRIFYLGSKPCVAEHGAEILRAQFPGLQIATAHGYFNAAPNSSENNAILTQINDYQPQILMVGMSMPRQENWIVDNLDRISSNVILPCGATIDYVAGAVPTPPRWAGRIGLEWLFRLIAEPNRLWRRYLVEPWFLLRLLLVDGLRKLTDR